MKKIFIAACLLMLTAHGFGQYSGTAYTFDKLQQAATGSFAAADLAYSTETSGLFQTYNGKNVIAPSFSSLNTARLMNECTEVAAGTSPVMNAQQLGKNYGRDTIYTFRRQWPVYASFFGAGLAYGTAEGLIWHTNNSNNAFWNPYKSWRTGVAVDGYHAARAVGIACFMAGAVLSVNDVKHPFRWGMLKKIAMCSVSYWVGQMITWHTVR